MRKDAKVGTVSFSEVCDRVIQTCHCHRNVTDPLVSVGDQTAVLKQVPILLLCQQQRNPGSIFFWHYAVIECIGEDALSTKNNCHSDSNSR